ncbi:MAG: hypothetical protein ACRC2W_12295 [Plesiomonas shigelloides]
MKNISFILFLLMSSNVFAGCEIIKHSDFKMNGIRYEESNGVILSSGRSFFYTYPDEKCMLKNKFIIQNDRVVSYASLNEYIYVNYMGKNGLVSAGWIKASRARLEKSISAPLEINNNDLFIYHDGIEINLGSDYSMIADKIKKHKPVGYEDVFMNEFRTIGGVDYKYYTHDFDGLYIESSNVFYDKENRDFDDYRITKIMVSKSDGVSFSSRGISVGSTMLNVIKQYGQPISKCGKSEVCYYYKNKKISFIGKDIVESIKLEVESM